MMSDIFPALLVVLRKTCLLKKGSAIETDPALKNISIFDFGIDLNLFREI